MTRPKAKIHPRPKAKPSKKPQQRKETRMPGLTVDTSSPQSQSQSQHSRGNSSSQSYSRSTSPIHPPYSPITPNLEPADLVTHNERIPLPPTYTHSQAAQTGIPQPATVPIRLDENTDAIALTSAMSILQMQARNAENDIKKLAQMKEKALRNPDEFAKALAAGEVHTKSDPLFAPSADDDEDEDQEMGNMAQQSAGPPGQQPNTEPYSFGGPSSVGVTGKGKFTMNGDGEMIAPKKAENWGQLPKPQNVVRCPPINWNKYAVVGESLDKLHADQVRRPTDGKPQVLGADGKLHFGGDTLRRTVDGVAAPYSMKDKIEKMGIRKGGKR